MKPLRLGMGAGLLAASLLIAQGSLPGGKKGLSAEEIALQKRAESFVAAFNKGDAKALAAHWAADGDFMDETGKHVKGRKAIEKALQHFFTENKGLKLRINIGSVRLISPTLAIEDGTTDAIPADGSVPNRARYTIVHVKKDGEWYLASVREAAYTPPNHSEHLNGLEWLIGGWVDEAEKGEVAQVHFSWSDNGNFILSSFSTSIKGVPIGGGTQWIAWDPAQKCVRSWTFQSSGGFGEGVWTQDGDNKWISKTTATLPDGKKVTANNIVTRLDANTVTWQSTNRTVDGKSVPDSPAVRMKRLK
jgi:uncharacterized protein (TIGR02246 family)